MEQILRAHRDQALQLLKENQGQSREGIEMLVKGRLETLAAAGTPSLTPEQLGALYNEIVDLSFVMFSLGYSMAHTIGKEAVSR